MHARRFLTYYPLQRSWGLGLASFQVGSPELRELPLERLGAPVLSSVAAVGAAGVRYANLAVLKGNEVENLLVVNAPRGPVHTVCNGMRLPAHQTAVGRAILMHLSQEELETIYPHAQALPTATTAVSARVGAGDLACLRSQLDRAREQGYVVVEQPASGISAIAAAVFDYAGQPIAGVGISVSTKPHGPDKAPQLVQNVRQAARTLSTHLGWQEDGSRR
jgi:DNA-binding IclR family transcriptional regulator